MVPVSYVEEDIFINFFFSNCALYTCKKNKYITKCDFFNCLKVLMLLPWSLFTHLCSLQAKNIFFKNCSAK